MDAQHIADRIHAHLVHLVEEIGARPPGSPANARANAYVREVLEGAGLHVRAQEFRTRWWEPGPGRMEHDGRSIAVAPSPYTRTCTASGPVVRLASGADSAPEGAVLVLDPRLVPEPVMPKAFTFYNPPEHQLLVERLESFAPAAVVAVSSGQPVFEDPDLAFPSVTVPPQLAGSLGEGDIVTLRIEGRVHEAVGEQLSASTADDGRRVVVSAHLDSKVTTPGAFDNAGSVAVLLAWAEVGLPAGVPIELVLFNGEDHFDSCGEHAWLAVTDLADVMVNLNLDGVGVTGRGTSVTSLGAPSTLDAGLEAFVAARPGWELAAPWFESDHAVFAMRGVPAVAVTSVGVHDLLTDIAHTPRDTLAMVDVQTLAGVVTDLPPLVTLLVQGVRG